MNIKKIEIDEISALYEKECINISNKIWLNPEESFDEFYAANIISKSLIKHDFNIKEYKGIKTEIIASFGPRNSKNKIAILGEYDALYGTSINGSENQLAHGCAHNLLGVGSLLSVIILSKLIKKYDLNFQITYYGCPAEEKGAGKLIMMNNDSFKGINACFTWHPAAKNSITNDIWIGSRIIQINFIGQESHASMSKSTGKNANNLMIRFINYLNRFSLDNISYIINPTLQNLSLIPKHASIDIAIRSFDENHMNNIVNKLKIFLNKNYCKSEFKIIQKEEYPVTKHDQYLQDIVFASFKLFVKDMKFNLNEIKIANEILSNIKKSNQLDNLSSMNIDHSWLKKIFNTQILYDKEIKYINAPTDVGAISKEIPTIQFQTICMPLGVSPHTKETTVFANTSIGHKGMILAGKILASSVLKYMKLM